MNRREILACIESLKRTDEDLYELIILTDYTEYSRDTFTIRFRRVIPYEYLIVEICRITDVRIISQSLQDRTEIIIIAGGHMEG